MPKKETVDRVTVKVIFRMDFEGGGVVFALFPEIPGTNDPRTCSCYEHVGQHHSADYDGCIARSRPATPAEYADLANELRSIGYDLIIKTRDARAAMYKTRVTELDRMNKRAREIGTSNV